ncbi:Troponin C-akin-1 protein [Frankliniella fusca]|uniref:Gamma-glutamylcyclotransferase family protein n=1 Tax=Frankliniella fusca TaxID=407009 RepID=A0AAE1H7E5_9NEOP|nr:Troponin C-akin-1 protein [Frankliniella fusca]
MGTQNVFVYGTLKKGEPNQHWLTNESHGFAKYLGNATTSEKYPLVIASRYNIPFLLDKQGTGQFVTGEIYEVDDKMLQNLDVLEDYPSWYVRERRMFKFSHDQSNVEAWVYLLQTYKESLLELPFLQDYKSQGMHGLKYCEPEKRDEAYDACSDVQGYPHTDEK